jgi:hypothetical protein
MKLLSFSKQAKQATARQTRTPGQSIYTRRQRYKNCWTRHFLCGLCVLDAARTCLPSSSLARAVSSKSTTTAFMRHVTLHSEVSERGVFYAVRAVSNTQYVKEVGNKFFPYILAFFKIRKLVDIKLSIVILYRNLPCNFKMTINY